MNEGRRILTGIATGTLLLIGTLLAVSNESLILNHVSMFKITIIGFAATIGLVVYCFFYALNEIQKTNERIDASHLSLKYRIIAIKKFYDATLSEIKNQISASDANIKASVSKIFYDVSKGQIDIKEEPLDKPKEQLLEMLNKAVEARVNDYNKAFEGW